jgi:hypothetical protein
MMRYMVLLAAALAGCSHAEESATTPPPNASYVAATNSEADAMAEATRNCRYFHSEPAVSAGHAGPYARFECKGRARGGESFFVERMGL